MDDSGKSQTTGKPDPLTDLLSVTWIEPDPNQLSVYDRLPYALGMLLSGDDFTAEQIHHRGRLARALAYLHGTGTVAGLKVGYKFQKDEIAVERGMAIDRRGRIIEVPRQMCIRLDDWYQRQSPTDLVLRPAGATEGDVIADVFLHYDVCTHGKTPAFATGPFDATDAVEPSRLRDSFRLELVPRPEDAPSLPSNPWPDLIAVAVEAGNAVPAGAAEPEKARADAIREAVKEALGEAVLNSWVRGRPPREVTEDPPTEAPLEVTDWLPGEYPELKDKEETAVFLARLSIRARAAATPQSRPEREEPTDDAVRVDNYSRLLVLPVQALAKSLLAGVVRL